MAAVMVEDFYHKFINPQATKKRLLFISRMTILIIGSSAILLALFLTKHQGGVFGVMKDISQVLTVPIATALLLGLVIRRTPPWTAMFSFIITFIVAWTTRYIYDIHLGYQALAVVGTSLTTFISMRLFWKKAPKIDRDRIEGFFRKLDTPVDVKMELSEEVAADMVSMLKVVGTLVFSVGLIITVPVIYLTDSFSISITAGLGLLMILTGILMFLRGKGALQKSNN
jgi:uncharacterized sodium:solute symporter family permease YidK